MKLLIADDEPEVIDGIQNLIDWNRYGIEVCAIAYNGEQALELIKSYDPDIVLIDIKMPKLNGLEAIEAAKKSGFQFETIILSGYDDFYFAQKAITLQTSNYLLKPCKPEEILEAVLKAKHHLEKEAEKKALFEKYQKYFYEHLPVLKERILNEVLLGIRTSQAEISETFKKYNVNLEGNFYRVIIIKPEPAHDFEHNFKSISIETIKIALMDTITEYILHYNHYCKLYFEIFQSKDDIVLVVGAYESLQKDKLEGLLKNLAEYVFSKTSIYLYFLIGNEVNSLEMLNKSYRKAFSIVELKFF